MGMLSLSQIDAIEAARRERARRRQSSVKIKLWLMTE
jgi:hypothetical protein